MDKLGYPVVEQVEFESGIGFLAVPYFSVEWIGRSGSFAGDKRRPLNY